MAERVSSDNDPSYLPPSSKTNNNQQSHNNIFAHPTNPNLPPQPSPTAVSSASPTDQSYCACRPVLDRREDFVIPPASECAEEARVPSFHNYGHVKHESNREGQRAFPRVENARGNVREGGRVAIDNDHTTQQRSATTKGGREYGVEGAYPTKTKQGTKRADQVLQQQYRVARV